MTALSESKSHLLSSIDRNDVGVDYNGLILSAKALDAEILSRLEPSKLKDISELNKTCWHGYRFMSVGHRLMFFIHCYRESYGATTRLIGKRFLKPNWMKANFLTHLQKGQFTSLFQAMATADGFGIPYDLYCEALQERHLRGRAERPLAPNQLYGMGVLEYAVKKWEERNEAGIYTAKTPLLMAEAYIGHPIQNDYMDYLCDHVQTKGNKAFYLARLMFDVKQLTPEFAASRFGPELVDRADNYR